MWQLQLGPLNSFQPISAWVWIQNPKNLSLWYGQPCWSSLDDTHLNKWFWLVANCVQIFWTWVIDCIDNKQRKNYLNPLYTFWMVTRFASSINHFVAEFGVVLLFVSELFLSLLSLGLELYCLHWVQICGSSLWAMQSCFVHTGIFRVSELFCWQVRTCFCPWTELCKRVQNCTIPYPTLPYRTVQHRRWKLMK